MKYCAERNREALRKVYIQEDNFHGQAATYIKDALESGVIYKNIVISDTLLNIFLIIYRFFCRVEQWMHL